MKSSSQNTKITEFCSRNVIFFFLSIKMNNKSEKVGFEPTEACTSSDFKSDAIDQLCHLSIEPMVDNKRLYVKSKI